MILYDSYSFTKYTMSFFASIILTEMKAAIYRPPPWDIGQYSDYVDANVDLTGKNELLLMFKGCHDAIMAFTDGPFTGGVGYEIVIGGWSNGKSIVR